MFYYRNSSIENYRWRHFLTPSNVTASLNHHIYYSFGHFISLPAIERRLKSAGESVQLSYCRYWTNKFPRRYVFSQFSSRFYQEIKFHLTRRYIKSFPYCICRQNFYFYKTVNNIYKIIFLFRPYFDIVHSKLFTSGLNCMVFLHIFSQNLQKPSWDTGYPYKKNCISVSFEIFKIIMKRQKG